MTRKQLTLCIVHEHPRVLLGLKKRGFGEGRWNGFGGKVLKGETIEDATRREMREEAGIELTEIEKMGIIDFEFEGNTEILEVHVFRAENFLGSPKESEEMKPEWFHVDEIPFESMWPDDKYWFPLFLNQKKFKGKFLFGPRNNIVHQELQKV